MSRAISSTSSSSRGGRGRLLLSNGLAEGIEGGGGDGEGTLKGIWLEVEAVLWRRGRLVVVPATEGGVRF